jgi:hypothetical protein
MGREIGASLKPFEVLLFDHEPTDEYARLRFELPRVGRPSGARDLLISIAVATRSGCRSRTTPPSSGGWQGLIVDDCSSRLARRSTVGERLGATQ